MYFFRPVRLPYLAPDGGESAAVPPETPADPPAAVPEKPAASPQAPPAEAQKPPAPQEKAPGPDAVKAARAAQADAELRLAAALAGVPKERLPYVLRMADRDGMDAEGAELSALADQAVAKVLSQVPGLSGVGTGSPAAPPRMPKVDLDQMTDAEYYAYLAAKKRSKE